MATEAKRRPKIKPAYRKAADERIATAPRRRQVVPLRAAGNSFDAIATQVGYSDESGARRAWTDALRLVASEGVADARLLEELRLDAMLAAVWPAVLKGDCRAVSVAVRVSESRRRLLGLDAPNAVEVTVSSDEVDVELESVLAAGLASMQAAAIRAAESYASRDGRT